MQTTIDIGGAKITLVHHDDDKSLSILGGKGEPLAILKNDEIGPSLAVWHKGENIMDMRKPDTVIDLSKMFGQGELTLLSDKEVEEGIEDLIRNGLEFETRTYY